MQNYWIFSWKIVVVVDVKLWNYRMQIMGIFFVGKLLEILHEKLWKSVVKLTEILDVKLLEIFECKLCFYN